MKIIIAKTKPSYKEFVSFLKNNEIYTPKKYKEFRKHNPELVKDFPSWTQIFLRKRYPEFNWNDVRPEGWSPNAPKRKEYAPYEDLVKLMKKHKIYTTDQWTQFRSNYPELVTSYPNWSYINSGRTYPEFSWSDIRPEGWSPYAPKRKEYAPYEDLVKLMKKHKIYTTNQWTQFRSNYPELVISYPNWSDINSGRTYPEFNWNDIRPEGWRRYWEKPYLDFVNFLKTNNLFSWKDYSNYWRSHPEIQKTFPSMDTIIRGKAYPEFNWRDIRSDDWRNWRKKKFAPYDEFLQFIKDNKIYSEKQWRLFRRSNPTLVNNFPSAGWMKNEYPDFSWIDFRELYGPKPIKEKSYHEFVNFAISKDITTPKQWIEYCERYGVPEGFYSKPWEYYPEFNWSHVWKKVHVGIRPNEQKDYGERYVQNKKSIKLIKVYSWRNGRGGRIF